MKINPYFFNLLQKLFDFIINIIIIKTSFSLCKLQASFM